MLDTARPEISVVVPVLDEAPSVAPLCRRLRGALEPVCRGYEVIFVAGGSVDGTEAAILRERAEDPRVKLLWLSRNFGHQQAVSAGLDYAGGDAVVTMDGDLQHPPELLPQLVALWRQGYEVVATERVRTADAGLAKRATSRWFYGLLNRLSGLELKEGSADFRLLDRAALEALRGMPERSRFLRGMVQWLGFERASVAYHAEARGAGATKYSLRRLLRLGLMATVAFSATPLYLVAVLGMLLAGLSFLYGLFAIAAKLLGNVPIEGWVSVLVAVTFTAGVQLICLGVAGAYIAQIYDEVKGRPIYVVRQAHGFTPHRRHVGVTAGAREPAGGC